MKVIHTHVERLNVIWKEILYSQYLSAVLAKKQYGNISFYGTPELVKQVQDIGIPYTFTNDKLLTKADQHTWSIPKLKVYAEQTEKFLHIDNDTFIFHKINLERNKKPFMFSHPDMLTKHIKANLTENFNKLINSSFSVQKKINPFFFDINNTYTRLFFKLFNSHSTDFTENLDIGSIPNMNIVYVEDFKTFASVTNKALEHYRLNKEAIDQEEYGPCYIEQFYIHQGLRAESKDYRKYSGKFKHTYFNELPLIQRDKHNNKPNINDIKYPLRFKLSNVCKCCGKKTNHKFSYNTKEELKELLDYDFEGFLHTTYMKWYDFMQAYTIHQLRKEIGDDEIRNVHNYFKKVYSRLNLPLKSGGENLYEELTGFKFNKVGSSIF